MKIVVGVLLAVNLLMLFWISQSENQAGDLAAERASNMPLLQLLSEKNIKLPSQNESIKSTVEVTAEKPKPVSPKVLNVSSEASNTEIRTEKPIKKEVVVEESQPKAVFIEAACYSFGPFEKDKVANLTISKLQKLGLSVKKRYETRRELSGFWVYIPPLPSRADARKVVSILKRRGVKDYLIVPTGVKKHAISLGFFRTREGAQQRKTHMQTLGLAPVMDESYKESSGFWLDFSSSATRGLPKPFVEAIKSQNDGVSVKKRPCLK
ncbi:MAG: SPOR domain-containing protein [Sulfuriflexus sp.]|nr:SPOR domain-containing protein [Sulfuriflexus sp.]